MRRKGPLLNPPPEPTAQRADSEQIVHAVVTAAIELGPHATLAAIAARAGVGTASLHRYFPSTAAIFAEVSRQTYRALLLQIRSLTARTDLDLRSMVREVCRTALQGPGLSQEHRRKLNLEIPLLWSMATVEPVYAEVIQAAASWIRTSIESPPPDLDARLFVAFGAVRGVVLMSLLFPGQAPEADVLLATLSEFVYQAISGDLEQPTPALAADR